MVEEKYLNYWRRRIATQQKQREKRVQETRREVESIVTALVERFGVTRAILFGSLVKGHFAPNSDIDLAVEGIAAQEYFAAVALANQIASRWVDLKPLEDLTPHFRRRVLETGEVIYARDD